MSCGRVEETNDSPTRSFKDRKSNATFGSIFDSGGLSQSPISHQEVPGAFIKLPYRSTGYSLESSLTSGGSWCLISDFLISQETRMAL